MRHIASGLDIQRYQTGKDSSGEHYRLLAKHPDGEYAGMHEYKVQDNALHPSESYLDRQDPVVNEALIQAMHAHHPELSVAEKAPPPAPVKEPEPEVWYHGTTAPRLRQIVPADKHRGRVIFPHVTDRGHAYATPDVDDAWDYAQKAFHSGNGHPGRPRVYEVQPMGHYEKDPDTDERGQLRGNWSKDYRSRDGWKVTRELPFPNNMGNPRDWR